MCSLTYNRKQNLNKQFHLKHPVCEEQSAVIAPKLIEEQQEVLDAPQAAKIARRMKFVEFICDLFNIKFNTNAKYLSLLKIKEHIDCEGRNCTDAYLKLIYYF